MRSYLRATRSGTIFHVLCIVLIAGLLLISAAIPVAQASTPVDEGTTDAYDYPITSESEQWKTFTSHDEMVAACQVPESLLKEMSTTGLVETVLNYPLYMDIYAFNTVQQGFDVMKAQFNGLEELLSRKDAGTVLLAKYRTMDPTLDQGWSSLERGQHMFEICNVEVLLAQQTIIDDMTEMERQGLLEEARIKYAEKQQGEYSSYRISDTASIVEKVLEKQRSSREYYSYVYTPKNTAVLVIVNRSELSQGEIDSINQYVSQYYPMCIKYDDPTALYNCHSWAWYQQSTSNNKWMNNPSAYMTDGSYVQTVYKVGGRKVYYPGYHTGIVTYYYPWNPNPAGWEGVKSKWGSWGLYLQPTKEYCPYPAGNVQYYKIYTDQYP